MNIDIRDFRRWLEKRGLGSTTIDQYARFVREMLSQQTWAPDLTRYSYKSAVFMRYAWKRFVEWRVGLGETTWLDPVMPDKPLRRGRRNVTEALDGDEWLKLLEHVRQGEHEADAAIAVMLSCGMRVGCVLRLDRAHLIDGDGLDRAEPVLSYVKKGGEEVDLPLAGGMIDDVMALRERLAATRYANVAALVTHGAYSDAAPAKPPYCHVRKRLRELYTRFGIRGRPNPHRLRHTAAARAYDATENVIAVQGLLGHANPETTWRYLKSSHLAARKGRLAATALAVPRRK